LFVGASQRIGCEVFTKEFVSIGGFNYLTVNGEQIKHF
jgi:hypothetical protein